MTQAMMSGVRCEDEPDDAVLDTQLLALQAHDPDILAAVAFEHVDFKVEFAVTGAQLFEPLHHLVDVSGIEDVLAHPRLRITALNEPTPESGCRFKALT